jgi:hypothetical protein
LQPRRRQAGARRRRRHDHRKQGVTVSASIYQGSDNVYGLTRNSNVAFFDDRNTGNNRISAAITRQNTKACLIEFAPIEITAAKWAMQGA